MPLATGDLPLPTSIPPWMGLAIIVFWVAVVVMAVRLLRWRRAIRAARRRPPAVLAVDSAPGAADSTARTALELSPPTPDAREGAG